MKLQAEKRNDSFQIQPFFDKDTYTLTYVIYDPETKDAIILDPVLDYDPAGGLTSTGSAEELLAFVEEEKLNVHYVLETHAHADHLSSSQYLAEKLDAKVGIGSKITVVQETFKNVFDLEESFDTNGTQFDVLLEDGQVLEAGTIKLKALHTPGHTPADGTYQIGNVLFSGDSLFLPDSGTGRCDFPAGDATALYKSVTEKIYSLPDDTEIFVGHDYQPGGREIRYKTTVGESKANNIQLTGDTDEATFVDFRTKRDEKLNAPRLLFPSVQVNINAGKLPDPSAKSGISYLKIPLNLGK